MKLRSPRPLAIVMATVLASPTASAAQAQFILLGDLPGGGYGSRAFAVSADGSVVVGYSASASGNEAFRWTATTGMVGLSDLPGGNFGSIAHGVSSDGAYVVGVAISAAGNEAFRWSAASGMLGLGDIAGGGFNSVALGTSASGAITVGYGMPPLPPFFQAALWNAGGAALPLGALPGAGIAESRANAVSADGAVTVGGAWSGAGFQAFRRISGGMQGLGDLPGGVFQSEAFAVSADGSVIVGSSSSTASAAGGGEAFRWTAVTGLVGLGDLPGGSFSSRATGVSADGTIVVGSANMSLSSGQSFAAFLWSSTTGTVNLATYLVSAGATIPSGWTITDATAISADGTAIVGVATDSTGREIAWLARFSLFSSAYCTSGTTTNACVPAISGTGFPSTTATSGFTVAVDGVEGQQSGLIFYGIDNSGFAPIAWGASSSFMCVKAPLNRIPAQSSGGTLGSCDGRLSIDWNAYRAGNLAALGQPFVAGQHVFAQGWFRDPPSPKTTMLSNGLDFVVQP